MSSLFSLGHWEFFCFSLKSGRVMQSQGLGVRAQSALNPKMAMLQVGWPFSRRLALNGEGGRKEELPVTGLGEGQTPGRLPEGRLRIRIHSVENQTWVSGSGRSWSSRKSLEGQHSVIEQGGRVAQERVDGSSIMFPLELLSLSTLCLGLPRNDEAQGGAEEAKPATGQQAR